MASDKWLTIQEVMSLLKISDETVYRWIRKGVLRGVKFGSLWRVDAESLEKLGRPKEVNNG